MKLELRGCDPCTIYNVSVSDTHEAAAYRFEVSERYAGAAEDQTRVVAFELPKEMAHELSRMLLAHMERWRP